VAVFAQVVLAGQVVLVVAVQEQQLLIQMVVMLRLLLVVAVAVQHKVQGQLQAVMVLVE
jgi:hypothetical protein